MWMALDRCQLLVGPLSSSQASITKSHLQIKDAFMKAALLPTDVRVGWYFLDFYQVTCEAESLFVAKWKGEI